MAEPRCLTDNQVREVLRATRELGDPRDHCLLLVALSTGLRLAELGALRVCDIRGPRGVREVIELPRAKRRTDNDAGRVYLTDHVRRRVALLLAFKRAHEIDPLPDGWPLWTTRRGPCGRRPRAVAPDGAFKALGRRAIEDVFYRWQRRLRWPRRPNGRPLYGFHCLRHTAIAAVMDKTGNLEVVRLFARHRSADTTQRYAHVRPDRILESLPQWR